MQALDAARFEPLVGSERMARFEAVAEATHQRLGGRTAVGGIVKQVTSGEDGILIEDPSELKEFGDALERLLRDPAETARMDRNARGRAQRELLGDTHLARYADVFAKLLG